MKKCKKIIGIVAPLFIGIVFEGVIIRTICTTPNMPIYVKITNGIYQTVVICVVTFVMIKFFNDGGEKLMSIKTDDKGNNKIEYKKWFIAIIIIIFLYIPVLSQFCPQIFSILHFKTSDSPTWIGYWGNILGSVLGIIGAFVVSAKYADNGDKKEGPRGPEGPQGPRGPEGPSGSPSDYSGIIEAINQLNTNIEESWNYDKYIYRNEIKVPKLIHRLIDLKRKFNDTNDVKKDVQKDVQKEYFLRSLENLFRRIRYDYYDVEPIQDVIHNFMNDSQSVYSINKINTIIDDLIYELTKL